LLRAPVRSNSFIASHVRKSVQQKLFSADNSEIRDQKLHPKFKSPITVKRQISVDLFQKFWLCRFLLLKDAVKEQEVIFFIRPNDCKDK